MKAKFRSMAMLLFCVALLTFSCKKSDSPGSNEVFAESNSFNPASITVKKGTTVTWINKDGSDHTVTADGGAFNKDPLTPGSSFPFTANTVGTFTYHCNIHSGMNGTLIVTN